MVAALELRDFAVAYNQRPWTVHDVNLSVERGTCIGILGNNGVGKSTIALGMIGVIPQLTPGRVQGSVVVDGIELPPAEPIERRVKRIGYTFQDSQSELLLGTVRECIDLRAGLSSACEQRINDAVRILKIGHLLDHPVERLSGGETMRVMLAAALNGPRVVVFDEATSALDLSAKRDFRLLLERLKADGVAVVLMGQRHEVIAPYCDRCYRVRDAQLQRLHGEEQPPVVRWPETLLPAARAAKELRLVDIFSRRGSFTLGPVNLVMQPGETVGVLGPNGAGKTVLLDTLGGGLRIIRGSAEFGNERYERRSWRGLAAASASITQSPFASIIGATIGEELGELRGALEFEQMRAAASGALDFLHSDRDPLELSFGQLRLLTFLAALSSPAILVTIDEPELGLDELSLSLVLAWVRHNRSSRGRTILISTHDFTVAAECDRCVLLDRGRIIADRAGGSAEELQTWYATRMTAEFSND